MELTRRFVFHGHATALSGHIFRTPAGSMHRFIDGGCASSLSVVGGRSHGEAKDFRFDDFLSFGTAITDAQGLFDDPKLATELTHGRGREEDLTTTTTVTVQLTDFKIGQKPTLSVELVRTALISRSPRADGEPSIQVLDSALSGISIDGRKLVVTLDENLFRQYDTQSKLVAAMAHQEFVDAHVTQLFLRTPIAGTQAPARPRLVTGRETIHGTLVKNIHWADDAFPGAEIDHHSLFIPNIGRVFFAEVIVTRGSRRLMMMRFQLGSDSGGSAGAGCVGSNGDYAI
jgi:hypothetical protein